MNKNTPVQKGFTIIEVLIVLAIAGLILLIVFLAVPALQRNSRNTTIRNDAAVVLGGVNEFVANNNGQLPTDVDSTADGTVTISSTVASTSAVTTKVKAGTTVEKTNGPVMPTVTGTILILFDHKCAGNSFQPPPVQKAVAAGFRVEGGTTNPTQCIES